MTRLEQQINFILEMDKEKEIIRQTYLADGSRRENDAEHAWHLALMCLVLQEYANEPVDLLRTMSMLLVHDLVEVDAGDTYAYDEQGNATKKERERTASERIFALLPEEQGAFLRGLWEEFEAGETPEAKFANALDKIQPALLNDASGGIAWLNHGIRKEQILQRNRRTPEGSSVLWDYTREVIEKNVKMGRIQE